MSLPVLIVGGGPAGLAAAIALARSGCPDIRVLEREPEAGGVPRHCLHRGFGFARYRWPSTGPGYAARLVAEARSHPAIRIETGVSVVRVLSGARLEVSGPDGLGVREGARLLLATGVRETPRSARLISGDRPFGVMNTGALQQYVTRLGAVPFRRPVIVGSELVGFSAILTLRHVGLRPVALIEAGTRIIAPRPGDLVARFALGVPVRTNCRLIAIEGREWVEAIGVEAAGRRERIACDGVVLSGRFVPEAALVRASHLELDPATGGPAVDQHMRTSDPLCFAAGNLLRAVETSGTADREGARAGGLVARDMAGRLPAAGRSVRITPADGLSWVWPQRLSLPLPAGSIVHLAVRCRDRRRGTLVARLAGGVIFARRINALAERTHTIALPVDRLATGGVMSVGIEGPEQAVP